MWSSLAVTLSRLYPEPTPTIHALPEYLADGALKADYEDTKRVLQVPWMGVIAMAHAHYRAFYQVLWPGLRPLAASAPFVTACQRLRAQAESAVWQLQPTGLEPALSGNGYAPREIDEIRDVIEVFSYGNFPYAMIATISRWLLEGHELSHETMAPPYAKQRAPKVTVPFLLMESHHVDAPTRAVYDDIKSHLGLPFVNTDYRALARWPSYFALAWQDLRCHIGTAGYEELVTNLHDAFVAETRMLPNPGALRSATLQSAATRDASLAEILNMVRLFQWLLPGLIINVAFFRAQLIPR